MCTQKQTPEMQPHLRGFSLCLLTLALCVKPLANVVADYARSDGQKKCNEEIHNAHPLSAVRLGKGSRDSLS